MVLGLVDFCIKFRLHHGIHFSKCKVSVDVVNKVILGSAWQNWGKHSMELWLFDSNCVACVKKVTNLIIKNVVSFACVVRIFVPNLDKLSYNSSWLYLVLHSYRRYLYIGICGSIEGLLRQICGQCWAYLYWSRGDYRLINRGCWAKSISKTRGNIGRYRRKIQKWCKYISRTRGTIGRYGCNIYRCKCKFKWLLFLVAYGIDFRFNGWL